MTQALLAVAHGSRDPRSAQTTEALLAAVRARSPGLPVAVGYLELVSPRVGPAADALVAAGARELVLVPLLLTAAYHSNVDVPREAAAVAARHPAVAVRVAGVLGPDPLLLAALERRLAEAGVRRADAPRTALVLGAAGTSNPRGRAVIEQLARDWRERAGWWDVVPAYASAARPTVAEAVHRLRAAGAPRAAVASYVLAPGRLPDRLVAGATSGLPVSAPLGDADELAEVVLARFAAAS